LKDIRNFIYKLNFFAYYINRKLNKFNGEIAGLEVIVIFATFIFVGYARDWIIGTAKAQI